MTTRSWLRIGVAGGGMAAISSSTIYLLYLAVTGARYALGLPQLILASVSAALLAALLAAALARWTTEPRHWFLGLGIIVGLLSIISPLTQFAAAGNQVVLALIQGTAAIVIVTTIRPRVPISRP